MCTNDSFFDEYASQLLQSHNGEPPDEVLGIKPSIKIVEVPMKKIRERLISYVWEGPMRCQHSDTCPCNLKLVFRSTLQIDPVLIHRVVENRLRSKEEMMQQVVSYVESLFEVRRGIVIQKKTGQTQETKIRNAIRATGHTNIHEIFPPTTRIIPCEDDPLQIPTKDAEDAVRKTDVDFFREQYGVDKTMNFYVKEVFNPLPSLSNYKAELTESVPSLVGLAIRALSLYNKSFGGTNGRPHVVSAMKGMEDDKVVRIIAAHSRPTDIITDQLKTVMDHVPEALDFMYNAMGVTAKIGKESAKVTLERTKGMYLGAAAGQVLENTKVIKLEENVFMEIKASNKKIHSHEPVLRASVRFWSGGQPIPVIFSQSWKTETKYSWVDQLITEAWERFIGKARTFEIGSEFFIIQERVAMTVRTMLERWEGILLGLKWPRGGVDNLASFLNIKPGQEPFRKCGDADFKALDQTIHYVFLQLMYTMGAVYFKKTDPDYKVMIRIVEYLARQISARVVHLVSRMWAVVVGKMPTGVWQTAHGNSWIVLLYYYLFCVMQSYIMPIEQRAKLQEMMLDKTARMGSYGDDHVQAISRDYQLTAYIGEEQFARWANTYVGSTLRDVRGDVPFVSQKQNFGHLKNENLVLLKQYFVRNRNTSLNQANYLPFRGTKDYAIKAVWGSKIKKRDIYDMLLSTNGHGYGTYGSNYVAWSWLSRLHANLKSKIPMDQRNESLGTLHERVASQDAVKRMRQASITVEEILGNYPPFEKLEDKNQWDAIYHTMTRADTLYD